MLPATTANLNRLKSGDLFPISLIAGVFILLASYLIGSIPWGYIVVRARTNADIRRTGSGGTGATNVSRQAGKLAGAVTLLLDALKGFFAVSMASSLTSADFGTNWWVAGSAMCVILGHIFPIWLGYRGGKGVATGLGAFVFLAPAAALGALLVFILVLSLTRYVSLASIVATASLPFWTLLANKHFGGTALAEILTTAITGGALIIFMHRGNISRLRAGSENRFF